MTTASATPFPPSSVLESRFRISIWATALLIASGILHLALLGLTGSSWSGPVSFRKPALFGISAGLTTWSITWLMTQLAPKKYDAIITNLFSIALGIEVAVITGQFWRGVPSHFNHSTVWNAITELTMLGLIVLATAAIFYLSFRTRHLRTIDPAMALAIRSGMCLLSLSCCLGILTTVLGEWNNAQGKPHEVWGKAGVLKFPHGVALHAIQLFPLLAWVAKRVQSRHSLRLVRQFLLIQLIFLAYASWQTMQGRGRLDFDLFGGILLVIAAVVGAIATIQLALDCVAATFAKVSTASEPIS